MSRYDGLIIPRSYSEYINKTDAATLQQALQLSGVLSGAVAAGDNKAVTSDAVNGALTKKIGTKFLYLGRQDLNSSVKYKINSNYGLLYIYGWAITGMGYCQLYLVSENPRAGYAVCSLISVGGESPQKESLVTSNYERNKITVSTKNINAKIYFISL